MDTHEVPVIPSGLSRGERRALYAAVVLGVVLGVAASYVVAPPAWLAQWRDNLHGTNAPPFRPPPPAPGAPVLIPSTVEAPAPTTTPARAPRITTEGTHADATAVPSSRAGAVDEPRPAGVPTTAPVGTPPVDTPDVPVGPEPGGESGSASASPCAPRPDVGTVVRDVQRLDLVGLVPCGNGTPGEEGGGASGEPTPNP